MNLPASPKNRTINPSVLVKDLESLDVKQREKARRTLAALGNSALPELTKALANPTEWVRWEAAMSLALTANPESVPNLVVALEDSSPSVRLAAIEALTAIGRPAIPELVKAVKQKPNSSTLRQGARRVLRTLKMRGKLAPKDPLNIS